MKFYQQYTNNWIAKGVTFCPLWLSITVLPMFILYMNQQLLVKFLVPPYNLRPHFLTHTWIHTAVCNPATLKSCFLYVHSNYSLSIMNIAANDRFCNNLQTTLILTVHSQTSYYVGVDTIPKIIRSPIFSSHLLTLSIIMRLTKETTSKSP